MILSKTPYRISFFGGGSDYPSWFQKHGGAVLSTTISHYCYISAKFRPPFFTDKSRVVWNRIEEVMDNGEIQHPSVKACLQYLGITEGVEIHHTGDLPARSGLGSSSTFTVGLLNALRALRGMETKKIKEYLGIDYKPNYHIFGTDALKTYLTYESIHVEQDVMKENVGVQDQIAASFGGFNHTQIFPDRSFLVKPVPYGKLEDYLLLCFTGISRTASEIAAGVVEVQNTGSKDVELHRMQGMVDEAIKCLEDYRYEDFGRLLHESWELKRSLTANVAPPIVDDIYERGCKAGAIGGKLLGAGGGGFMLFFAKPEDHDKIRAELKELLWVPFKFSDKGSEIIYGL